MHCDLDMFFVCMMRRPPRPTPADTLFPNTTVFPSAGRRDPLAIFHEAIERPTPRHQAFRLIGPGIGDRPRLDSMRDVLPQRLATLFQPQVEGVQALGLRRGLP